MKSKGTAATARRTGTSKSSESHSIISASVFGACVGVFTAVILLLVCSFICISAEDPNKLISPLAIFAVIISYLFSGFAASRRRKAALPCGALSGGLLTAVLFLVSLFISKDMSSGLSLPVSMLIRLSFIAVSILGALLGVYMGSKRVRRAKR